MKDTIFPLLGLVASLGVWWLFGEVVTLAEPLLMVAVMLLGLVVTLLTVGEAYELLIEGRRARPRE